MTNKNEFSDTYNFFNDTFRGLGVAFPVSLEVWQTIPDDLKSAALFVNFYQQILMAYNRLKTPASVDAECVSEVLMYLQKNVRKIMDDPHRYTPAYIYRVSYNCLMGPAVLTYTSKTGVNGYFYNTVPNIINGDDGELDLFDAICTDCCDDLTPPERLFDYVALWDIIDGLDEQSKKVVYGFMDGRQRIDGVPAKERRKIVEELKKIFASFV